MAKGTVTLKKERRVDGVDAGGPMRLIFLWMSYLHEARCFCRNVSPGVPRIMRLKFFLIVIPIHLPLILNRRGLTGFIHPIRILLLSSPWLTSLGLRRPVWDDTGMLKERTEYLINSNTSCALSIVRSLVFGSIHYIQELLL